MRARSSSVATGLLAAVVGIVASTGMAATLSLRRSWTHSVETAAGAHWVELRWVRGAFGAGEIPIERRGPFASGYTKIASLDWWATSYCDDGLAASTVYSYRVAGTVLRDVQTLDGGRGLSVEPVCGASRIQVRHPAFEGFWTLFIPEYGYTLPGAGNSSTPFEGVNWSQTGAAWTYVWGVDAATKRAAGVDFTGRVVAAEDHVDVELTGTNVGADRWNLDGTKLALYCFRAAAQPRALDYRAERTYLRKRGAFVRVTDLLGGKFQPHRMWSIPVDANVERLAVRQSSDGAWVSAIAADTAGQLSFNFTNEVACIHSNPTWPALAPGESFTSRVRIYLIRGSLEDLWSLYERDWGPSSAR
jgi:hypothetical protein